MNEKVCHQGEHQQDIQQSVQARMIAAQVLGLPTATKPL
jgi:hypothetical protein